MKDDVLEDEWKWSVLDGYSKALKPKSSQIRAKDRTFVYTPGRNMGRHGDWQMDYNGSLPILKLAILTYYEDEILAHVDEKLQP